MGLKRLLIARHGNTFEAGETTRRIGVKSDLQLTDEGRAQAKRIASWLNGTGLEPKVILTGRLQRTKCTAKIIALNLSYSISPVEAAWLDEVDYGCDEGRPESEVLARVGEPALSMWDQLGKPVHDWPIDRDKMIRDCRRHLSLIDAEETLLVTSNGLARFILIALGVDAGLPSLKIQTGGLAVIDMTAEHAALECWNMRP